MKIFVLYRYWNTPDNEGSEVFGVFRNEKDAHSTMIKDVDAVRLQYPIDFWSLDMTWEEEREVHLGYDPMNGKLATIYCWNIAEMEVR